MSVCWSVEMATTKIIMKESVSHFVRMGTTKTTQICFASNAQHNAHLVQVKLSVLLALRIIT